VGGATVGRGGRRVIKEWAKRAARPATSRLFARVDARVAPLRAETARVAERVQPMADDLAAIREHFGPALARVQTHDKITREHAETIEEMRQQLSALNEYLPVLLNAVSSQNAANREMWRAETELRQSLVDMQAELPSADDVAHVNKRLDELGGLLAERIAAVERRSEFIRREVLFEARYGGQEKGLASAVESTVVSTEKLAAAADNVRLNLGCGHIPVEDFLNVDARPLDGVDIVAEVGDLPFEPATVAHIHSAHLLEHFPVEELTRRLLPYWCRLLRPGGTFSAVVPDSETMIEEYAAGRFSFDDLRLVTYGEQEYDGDFHFNMFSKASLCELLGAVGFTDVKVVESGRRNGACYEMEIEARRPGGHD
jgi:SAM-dependent methyltransferase